MSDISRRIAALTPQQRALLSRLQATHGPAGRTPPPPEQSLLHLDPAKQQVRAFYDTINDQLNGSEFAEHALFLNFGYASAGGHDRSPFTLPPRTVNHHSIKLVLEVIGEVDLTGLDVLDVGCGRGGSIAVINCYFEPRRVVGVELSASAVAFCSAHHRGAGTTFLQGDAEHLPFPDESFDVCFNLELSHSYPAVDDFYREVYRVLRQGGRFLYSDVFAADRVPRQAATLEHRGFLLEYARDITENVLRSCDQTAAQKTAAHADAVDDDTLRDFLGVEGSRTYEDMRRGLAHYRILHLAKRGEAHGG